MMNRNAKFAAGRGCATAASQNALLHARRNPHWGQFRASASRDVPGGTPSHREQHVPSSAAPLTQAGARAKALTTSPSLDAPYKARASAPARRTSAPRPPQQQQQQQRLQPATQESSPPPASQHPPAGEPAEAVASAAAAPARSWGQPSLELPAQYQLSAQQHQQLEVYLDYMLEINQSMNLTAVRDKGEAWQRHVVDSLALLPVIERYAATAMGPQQDRGGAAAGSSGSRSKGGGGEERVRSGEGSSGDSVGGGGAGGGGGSGGGMAVSLRLVDVGTGAGLPGMVLAVARPHWKITLLDSLRKRCDFLREAAARSGLRNVEVVWCRAEEGGHMPELRQAYDMAVARAVAESRVLAELCMPFVRVGGLWIAAKGPDPEAEVAAAASAIRQLGGRQLALERVDSHSAEGQRTALVVAKVSSTPSKFPRQAGTPNKKPL